MANQWNTNIPVVTNGVAADVADMNENLGWVKDLLRMVVGWKDSSLGTVGPPGPQRAKFVSTSDTVITIGPGIYFHDGTVRQTVWWDADLTFTVGSGANASSDDLGASEWHYVFIDDSAITTLGGPELDNTCFLNKSTAPTWSDTKHGWYTGADKCIFAFYSDGDSDILEFQHDGDFVLYADHQTDITDQDIDDTWTDIEAALTMPAFARRANVTAWSATRATVGFIYYWLTKGQTGTTGHIFNMWAVPSDDVGTNTLDVITNSDQLIQIKGSASAGDKISIRTNGWYFPIGV